MPLFHINGGDKAYRIAPSHFSLERQLQRIVEANLLEMFGVQFIASEFVIRGEQPGRIDTLGLDLDGAPTIIEYKRDQNENVINQGLYYMNWLLDHRGDFVVAAREALAGGIEINWGNPRLMIIAESYAKWDTHAVKLMGEAIELWTYTLYGDDLLYLELVYGQQRSFQLPPEDKEGKAEAHYTIDYHLAKRAKNVQELYQAIREGIFALEREEGDIIETPNKLYIAYRHGRNFCEVEVQARAVKLHIDIPYERLEDPRGMARDVSDIGHWGTGATNVKIDSIEQVEYALGLIEQAYRLTM